MADLPGACDSHTHVFPPGFGFAFSTSYAPPAVDLDDHLAMLDASALAYGVVVQPAVYGTDQSALLDVLSRAGGRLRGVGALTDDAELNTISALYASGIRGLRFTEVRDPVSGGRYRGTVGLDALGALAPKMRSFGLHAQIWAPLADILGNIDRLRSSGVPVVLDHMAMVDVSKGSEQSEFVRLLELLDEGWLWVKLSLCRVSTAVDYRNVRPFHDALVERAPHRMLWASDWPFVRMAPAPDPRRLLARFMEWVPDKRVRTMILRGNPAELYGFEESEE